MTVESNAPGASEASGPDDEYSPTRAELRAPGDVTTDSHARRNLAQIRQDVTDGDLPVSAYRDAVARHGGGADGD